MSELFKTDFLFRKGYLVTYQKNGVKIKFNGECHGWIRLKQGTDILGLLEHQALLSQGTQDWEWNEIGNIHNPDLLELLVKAVDKRVTYDPKAMLPFRIGVGRSPGCGDPLN